MMQIGDSWLVPHGVDRERMIDMEARLRPIRRKTFVVLGAGLLACAPWIGVWPIVPLAVAVVVFWIAGRVVPGSSSPGVPMFAAWAASQAIIASSVALTGHLTEITLCWLAIPITTLSARFSTRGIAAGVVLTLALMATVLVSSDPAALLREPPLLLAPAAVVVATAMLSTALMGSDLEHREGTLIDPLTGMLNVNALRRRAEELAQQSEVNGDPVGVIAADIDKFKSVNDSRGHATGDTVLKEVAYQLRKSGRSFELAHRSGGDEFVILVPGANLVQCRRQADAMREAIERMALVDGQRVTMSFGVATSRPGAPFDYATVHASADAALYEAKRSGRNCVCTAALPAADVTVAARQRAWREAVMSAQTPS